MQKNRQGRLTRHEHAPANPRRGGAARLAHGAQNKQKKPSHAQEKERNFTQHAKESSSRGTKQKGSPRGTNNTGPSRGANVVTPSKRQRSAGPAPPAQTHSCPRRGTHHGRQGCSARNMCLPAGAADRPAPARGLPPCRPSPHWRGPSPCGGCIVTRARGADRYHPRPRRFRPLVTGHVTHRGGGGARPQTPPPRSLLKPPPAHGRHRYSGAG